MLPKTQMFWLLALACAEREQRLPQPTGTTVAPIVTSDGDGDGFAAALDCDDDDPLVFPGAPDAPYDGVDADCAGGHEYDADGDGHTAQAFGGRDCDDADPNRYHGAPRVCGNAIDDDCDLAPDCDLRGEIFAEDIAIGRYTGTELSQAGGSLTVGDVGSDGITDLLISGGKANTTWLFRGPLLDRRTASEADGVYLGGTDNVIADFDGDGRNDIAVSEFGGVFTESTTRIWSADTPASQGPDAQHVHAQGDAASAHATAAGDLNGDGVGDLLVGGLTTCDILSYYLMERACVQVLHGPFQGAFNDLGVDAILFGEESVLSSSTGNYMNASSDLTGDGAADLFLLDQSLGSLYIAETPLAAEVWLEDATAKLDVEAAYQELTTHGATLAQNGAVGDLDGDGYADVVVAIGSQGAYPGLAWVFPGPFTAPPSLEVTLAIASGVDAISLALPGDLDGDGLNDLIAGDQINDDGNGLPAADIFYAPRGTVEADATLETRVTQSYLQTFAGAGDLDGDGLADFVAGDTGLPTEKDPLLGGAWIILGLPTGF